MNIKPSEKVAVHVAAPPDVQRVFTENEPQILKLARLDRMLLSETLSAPKASAKAVLGGGSEVAIPLEGLIDFELERRRLQNQLSKLSGEQERLSAQLANQNFVERAPAEKVQELRERQTDLRRQITALKQNVEALVD